MPCSPIADCAGMQLHTFKGSRSLVYGQTLAFRKLHHQPRHISSPMFTIPPSRFLTLLAHTSIILTPHTWFSCGQ